MNKLTRPQLCLVTDPAAPDLLHRVETALQAGISMLQLRGHQLSAAQLYRFALQLRPRCQEHGVTFIVNDRLDVGLAVQADGVQLGAHSLPLPVARQIVVQYPQTDQKQRECLMPPPTGPDAGDCTRTMPNRSSNFALGASVHTLSEAQEAVAHGADFLLVGTIFATPSHPGEPGTGPALLNAIKRIYPTQPVLAIGGINALNARDVMEAGADGIAVISAILQAADVTSAVKALR